MQDSQWNKLVRDVGMILWDRVRGYMWKQCLRQMQRLREEVTR
jgi:hypothetical protein